MTQIELYQFTSWASVIFPGFAEDPALYNAALQEWAVEQRVRQLEAEGMTRSDAQAVAEAESI